MPILGAILKKGIQVRESLAKHRMNTRRRQNKVLRDLMRKSKDTAFGEHYMFDRILKNNIFDDAHHRFEQFKEQVPVFNYNRMYDEWWHRAKAGEPDISWPGQVKYFALSSGTSEASTKHIPITDDMIKAIQKTSIRQILCLANFPEIPASLYEKGILMLGGSTHLNYNGTYFEGDLSGITASQLPFWFQHFYKPGKKISQTRDWNRKLDEITEKAKDWDIGFVVGVPAWIQIMMERIIEHYKLETIHDIWPNLKVYTHGGVSFEPYKKGFEKLLREPLTYIETYLASEGFIAFQAQPGHAMRMVLNNGIFFEFVPFTDENFDVDGEIVANPTTYMIDQVKEGEDYALLLSTCAGAWRYLIGDVIKFVSKEANEIVITGRTKHYLSLCGEHLSVENMNKALSQVAEEMDVTVREFAVAGIPEGTLFAHQWYVGTETEVDEQEMMNRLDEKLKELNDDYRVERIAALKKVYLKRLPVETFYEFMEKKGKVGGQNKFPRVLKKTQHAEWLNYLKEKGKA